jgi:hypothetical protein
MEWVSGNVYIRAQKLAKAGDRTQGHKHNFDHTTIVFSGSVHVHAVLPDGTVIDRDFGEGTLLGLRHFLVRAEVEHEITALVDGTEYWCVYSHRTPQGDVVLANNGWMDAYV